MSNLALLAPSRPTEVPKGPFVAFQQGKDALPDGRRVSNWYLLDDSGNSVCLALAAGSAADVPHAAYYGSGLGARFPPLAATRPKKWRHIYANFRLVLLSIYPRGTRNTCVRYMHSFDEALGVLRPTNGSQEHGGTRSEGLLLPRFQVLAVVGVESERRDAHYHYSAVSPRRLRCSASCAPGDVAALALSNSACSCRGAASALSTSARTFQAVPPSLNSAVNAQATCDHAGCEAMMQRMQRSMALIDILDGLPPAHVCADQCFWLEHGADACGGASLRSKCRSTGRRR